MTYPGRIIRIGETDQTIVNAVAARLTALGYTMTSPAGLFDLGFKQKVKLFQAQHVDLQGMPLLSDGEIGPLCWGALFGATPVVGAAHRLAQAALQIAGTQVGVREDPVGSNKGPMVNEYLASTNTAPGSFWCMAFVHWCFQKAATQLGVPNTFPRTAGCLDAWQRSTTFRITKQMAVAEPTLVAPGSVFILDFGGGNGHTGFVEASVGGTLQTIEGNSNSDGSNNGIGVFRLNRRSVMSQNLKGFIFVP